MKIKLDAPKALLTIPINTNFEMIDRNHGEKNRPIE